MKRYTFISEMKTIALVLVVVAHCMLFYGDNPFWPELAGFQSPAVISVYGVIDASVIASFVMCSGFLLADSCARRKKPLWQMALDRTKRLLIPYYLYGALWLVPLYTLFDIKAFGRDKGTGFGQGLLAMVLGQFSDHLWFLWMLVWITLFFVLTRALLDRRRVWLLLVLTLAFALIDQYLLAQFPYFKLSQIAPYLLCFWLGACLYLYDEALEKLPKWSFACIGLLCLALIICYDVYQDGLTAVGASVPFGLTWGVKLLGAVMMYGFFRFFAQTKASEKLLASRAWVYSERHSLNIYLVNCPFNYLYFRLLYPRIGQHVLLCIVTNILLTFVSIYLTVWLQDLCKGLFRRVFPGKKRTT
ncbi:MAG: acyltransferase [Lachnospiraceae bacterium]|nr:acyltransferase [Lachnospiraceae bacterium]